VQSPLLESSSIEKIMEIDSHIGCAMSGLTADARTMVDHARVTSQMHAFTYDEPIGIESCTQAVCDLALRFGESVEDDDALMVRSRLASRHGVDGPNSRAPLVSLC
jgi:20S proteasome subunit alpha 5